MVAIKGHFDGKVIVPDEPLNLPANQRLLVHIQPVNERATDFRQWIGLGMAAPLNPAPRFASDRDLWE
jgi:hypothetical protein